MKIHTKLVYQYSPDTDTFDLVEDEFYDYEGPVAMAKGGGGQTTQIQKADPWSGVQPYLKEGYSRLSEIAQQTPTFYPGQTYAGFDPMQMASQQGMLNYAGSPGVSGTIGNVFGTTNQAMGAGSDPVSQMADRSSVPANSRMLIEATKDPNSGIFMPDIQTNAGVNPNDSIARMMSGTMNPWIGQAADSAMARLNDNFKEQIMPSIASNAVATGGVGGSRQGVAEGIAAKGLAQAQGDMLASMYLQGANKAIDQQNTGTGMALSQQQANNSNQLQKAGLGLSAEMGRTGNALSASNALMGNQRALRDMNYTQQVRGASLAPQAMSLGMTPFQLMSQVGDARQAMTGNQIAENMARHNFSQNADWERIQQYLATLNGAQGGTSTVTGPNPNQSNRLTSALGGGLMGAQLGSMVPGFGAGAAGSTGLAALGPAGIALGLGGLGLGLFG